MNQLRTIVEKLNELFDSDWNISSFNQVQGERLLTILENVLRAMDMYIEEKSDFGSGQCAHILNVLAHIKYSWSSPVDEFHEGLKQGNRSVIHPLLFFLLSEPQHVKKRFYLGKYVTKVNVPRQFLNNTMQKMIEEHSSAIESFWQVYSEHVQEERNAAEANEMETDIGVMRMDIRNVEQRIQSQKDKLHCSKDFLDHVRQLMDVRKKHAKLDAQFQNDMRHLQEQIEVARCCQRRRDNKVTHVEELHERNELYNRSATIYTTIVANLANEKNVFANVAMQPTPTSGELQELEEVMVDLQQEVNEMQSERRQDVAMEAWKTQAKAMRKKREQLAKQIVRTRLNNEQVLNKAEDVCRILGGDVMKGKVFKEYIADLKGLSNVYKEHKFNMNALENEIRILTRTLLVLHESEPSLATMKMNKVPEEIASLSLLDVKRRVEIKSREASEELKVFNEEKRHYEDVKKMYMDMLDEHHKLKNKFNEKTGDLPVCVESLERSVMKLEQLLRLEEEDLMREEMRADQLQDDLFRYSNMFIEQAGDISPSEVLLRKLGVAEKCVEELRGRVERKRLEGEQQQRENANVKKTLLMIGNAKMQ